VTAASGGLLGVQRRFYILHTLMPSMSTMQRWLAFETKKDNE